MSTSDVDLELIIHSAYSEGQARFGEVWLDQQTYAQRIDFIAHKHLGPAPLRLSVMRFVKSLHAADLYLATACAQHGPGTAAWIRPDAAKQDASVAWRMLEKTYKNFILDLVRFFCRQTFAARDLADSVLADLYLPDRTGTSRIATYEGRSSLSTWLRVIVWNRAINAQRSSAYSRNREIETEIPDEPALRNLEMTVNVRRYQSALKDALVSACRELTDQERLMLLWRYEEELQLGQIAKALGIHQSTVTRQLERMQGKLRKRVAAILADRHSLNEASIRECFEGIALGEGISILDTIRNAKIPNKPLSASPENNCSY